MKASFQRRLKNRVGIIAFGADPFVGRSSSNNKERWVAAQPCIFYFRQLMKASFQRRLKNRVGIIAFGADPFVGRSSSKTKNDGLLRNHAFFISVSL
jgi:hypothetical protein